MFLPQNRVEMKYGSKRCEGSNDIINLPKDYFITAQYCDGAKDFKVIYWYFKVPEVRK